MKRQKLFGLFFVLILVCGVSLAISTRSSVSAQNGPDPLLTGARLYDDWMSETGVDAPAGNQPLWETQSTNTLSGADTWRCATCHGWDYQGKDGAYASGANNTGFSGVYTARTQSPAELIAVMKGETNPAHDFSPDLSEENLQALATFIQDGLTDDNQFIDLTTRRVLDGDAAHGEELYGAVCSQCHGADGATLQFRQQGQPIVLGTLADQDPWRFLHRTRFGLARVEDMKIGYDLGWSVQDGRDVLLYAQSLPGGAQPTPEPALQGETQAGTAQPGGPANSIFTGILTALGAMATSLGFALILGGLLVGILLVAVWFLRNKE